jgi:quinol monooxygenase YgiN
MHIVLVYVHVKPDLINEFKEATIVNSISSRQEPGIARFDVIQELQDPARFVLVEVYRSDKDPARHKETAHYQTWKDTVAPMMAEPRTSCVYTNIAPDDHDW